MKEENPGLFAGLLGRKSSKPKDIKRRFQQCEAGALRLRNKNNILLKQCENQLELQGNIKTAISENCHYLEGEVQKIIDSLQVLSIECTDSVGTDKIRQLLKKIKKQIIKSKDILNEMVKKASTPSIFIAQKENCQIISKSQQVGQQKQKQDRKRSTGPNYKENVLNDQIEKVHFLKNGQTKWKEMQKIIQQCHNRALQMHKTLSDRIGQGKVDSKKRQKIADDHSAKSEKKVKNVKKASKKCFIIMIIIIILVLLSAGTAIYLLFY